jgi:methionyl-tRNA formyltransferase
LNVTVLANRDLASNLALNHLLPDLAEAHRVTVYLSDAVGGNTTRPRALEDLKFFEQLLFNELLFPLVDAGGVVGELLTFNGLGRYTTRPVESLNRINCEESLATLGGDAPELVLSIRYGGILREDAIAIPPLGVINLHSGLLPQYRGVMASFHALLAGEEHLGTTIHYISDPGIDTGEVIAHTRSAVEPGKSYLWQVLALYPPAIEKLLACVADLAHGKALPTRPQGSGGQYFSFPEEEDLAAFQARGLRLYNVDEIHGIAQRYTGHST